MILTTTAWTVKGAYSRYKSDTLTPDRGEVAGGVSMKKLETLLFVNAMLICAGFFGAMMYSLISYLA